MLNICVDPECDAMLRASKNWDDLAEKIRIALKPMEGPCMTSVAAMSGLSVQTVQNIRRGAVRPTVTTMRRIIEVLAPGHELTLSGSCAVRPVAPILPTPLGAKVEWRRMSAPHSGFAQKFIGGLPTAEILPLESTPSAA